MTSSSPRDAASPAARPTIGRRAFTIGLACAAAPPALLAAPGRALGQQRANGPDLVVTMLAWTPGTPVAGDAVTFSATVMNQGRRDAPDGTTVRVTFALGDAAVVAWSDDHTAAIPAGATAVLTASGGPGGAATWPATAGTHAVTATVDDPDAIAEQDEGNNALTATLTVVDPAAGPDLAVTALRWSEDDGATWHTGTVRAGSNVLFEADVLNQGTAPTPAGTIVGVAFYIDGAKVSWSDDHTAAIPAGSTVGLRANDGSGGGYWNNAQVGDHTASAFVDDIGRIPDELNETNNTLDAPLPVVAAEPPVAPGLYGHYWNGDRLGNLEVGGQNGGALGRAVAYRFRAQTTGDLRSVKPFLVHRPGYALGDGGSLRVDVHADDGTPDHLPAGPSVGHSVLLQAWPTGQPEISFPVMTLDRDVPLVAGNIYHLWFTNPHPNPANNYVSLDLVVPGESNPMQPACSDIDLATLFKSHGGASWALNVKTPVFDLIYADGGRYGPACNVINCRSQSLLRTVQGGNMVRQGFTVDGGDRVATRLRVRLRKVGAPGPLTVLIETATGAPIELGTIAAADVGTAYGWVWYDLAAPVTLVGGQTYHVRLSAAADSANHYQIFPHTDGAAAAGYAGPDRWGDAFAQYTSDGSSWASSPDDDWQMYFTVA